MKSFEKIKRKTFNLIGLVVNKVGQNEAQNNDNLDRARTKRFNKTVE